MKQNSYTHGEEANRKKKKQLVRFDRIWLIVRASQSTARKCIELQHTQYDNVFDKQFKSKRNQFRLQTCLFIYSKTPNECGISTSICRIRMFQCFWDIFFFVGIYSVSFCLPTQYIVSTGCGWLQRQFWRKLQRIQFILSAPIILVGPERPEIEDSKKEGWRPDVRRFFHRRWF